MIRISIKHLHIFAIALVILGASALMPATASAQYTGGYPANASWTCNGGPSATPSVYMEWSPMFFNGELAGEGDPDQVDPATGEVQQYNVFRFPSKVWEHVPVTSVTDSPVNENTNYRYDVAPDTTFEGAPGEYQVSANTTTGSCGGTISIESPSGIGVTWRVTSNGQQVKGWDAGNATIATKPSSGGTVYSLQVSAPAGYQVTVINSDGGNYSMVLSPGNNKWFRISTEGDVDECTNITGIQTEKPEGWQDDNNDGICDPIETTPPPPDQCLNIAGTQTQVPEGHYQDENTHCHPIPGQLPPPILTASTSSTCGGEMIVSWTEVEGATSYNIYRGNSLLLHASHGQTSLVSYGTPGETYNFYARSRRVVNGTTELSNPSFTESVAASAACVQPAVGISATPASVRSGESTILNWTSTDTATCSASASPSNGGWTGSKALNGSASVGPLSTATSFVITCTDINGTPVSDSVTVNVTQSATATINVNANLSAATWTINPGSINGSGLSGSHVITPNQGQGSTYTLTPASISGYSVAVTNSDGPGSSLQITPNQSKSFTITYTATPTFNYSLTNGGNISVTKEATNVSVQQTVNKTLTSGSAQSVDITASGQPSGVSLGYSNRTCSPTCASTITFTVAPTASAGTYPITVTGTSSGVGNKTTNFNLTINPSTSIPITCEVSPSTAVVGQPVTWTAEVSGGVSPYTFAWSGTNIPASPAPSANPYSISYQTTGTKSAAATVTDAEGGQSTCPAQTIDITVDPSFEEF